MPKAYQPKTREVFPAAEGWVKIVNGNTSSLSVLIEPWAVGHDLAPGENCYVHLVPEGEAATLEIKDEFVVAFCADAIYQNGIEICDFSD